MSFSARGVKQFEEKEGFSVGIALQISYVLTFLNGDYV